MILVRFEDFHHPFFIVGLMEALHERGAHRHLSSTSRRKAADLGAGIPISRPWGGARVRSAVRTRAEALGAVKACSAESQIRTTNARPRRAGLPRSGSGWRIRGGLDRQAQPFESHTQGAKAPCSLPTGNKKPPEGGFFISWRKRCNANT